MHKESKKLNSVENIFLCRNSWSVAIFFKYHLKILSEIIQEINDFYGKNLPDGSEESSKKLISEIISDEEFVSVLKSDNTDSNKRDKLEKIYKEKNIKTLDVSTKLFEFFNQKEMRERVINYLISRPEKLEQFQENI